MYPGPEVLQEIGRVTIAGSRLDIEMGHLWHHLDRSKAFETTRWKPGAIQCDQVRKLAEARLVGDLYRDVISAVDAAEAARALRNDVVHQGWLLRGPDAMRPISDITTVAPEDLAAYIEQWERESKDSDEWLRVPRREIDVLPAQPVEELRAVERALSDASNRVTALTFRVASSRDVGAPPGYVHPA